jgi:uncharacterized membrane protein SpoIIM required for sporulation/ABC-type transport system involved in multi-copper enzyme maturation permease subunit
VSKIRAALLPAWIIARREILDVLRDWRQVIPSILLALGFPLLMDFSAKTALDFVAEYGGTVMGERFVPFLLLMVGFFPVSASLYTALGSFAGEKERKSLEPLLVTPLTDWQLYLGKFVGTVIPPLASAYLGMGVYTVGLIVLAEWHIPASLLVLVLVLATVQAAVMVAVAVVISSQTTSVRAAGLLASFIILPVGGLILSESFVMISATPEWLWAFVVALTLVAAIFIRMGVHMFDREELLIRDIDQLDLKKGWRIFAKRLRARVPGRLGWYRLTWQQVVHWRLPLVLMMGVWVGALLLGYHQADRFAFPDEMLVDLPTVMTGNLRLLQTSGIADPRVAGGISLLIIFQNLRALILEAVLGVMTFGVVAVMVFMLPWGLIGYLAGQFSLAGVNPFAIAPFVVPHAVLELPALLLASTAILHWGATTIAIPPGRSLGEVWLEAGADFIRVLTGLVLPLLVVAALLETFLTPAVVAWFFS